MLRYTLSFLFFFALTLVFSCELGGTKAHNAEFAAASPAPVTVNKDTAAAQQIDSPFQTKPRRAKIKFPEDCTSMPRVANKNWDLQTACANALRDALPEMPQDECGYDKFRQPRSYEVIEDPVILEYTVLESDGTDIEVLAKKLGTTGENIHRNSQLTQSEKLKAGQTIKYQKASTRKDDSSWLESENEIVFYPFSVNKYLVQVKCDASAYNVKNVYLMYDESKLPAKVKVLEFPWLEISDDGNTSASTRKVVGGRLYIPKTKKLVVFVKGNGAGDFGQYARYSLLKEIPELEEFRAKSDSESGSSYGTDEVMKRPPIKWKRYFPKD